MNKKEKVEKIYEILEEKFNIARVELNYETLYQLMVAVILSAQCTDKRVNIVTKELFKVVREPIDIYNMELETLEEYIKSTGFYKNKAKNIKNNARQIIEELDGKIPDEMEELIKLSGVGRKTANVILSEYFNKNQGVVVDTHVKRLTNLIGLVDTPNVEIIERELMKIVPKDKWFRFSHFLILQGRDKCIANRPRCSSCEIKKYCKYGSKKV